MLKRREVCYFQELFEVVVWDFIIGKIEVLELIRDDRRIERINDSVSWKIQRYNARAYTFYITIIA